jgi:hypothetical protein
LHAVHSGVSEGICVSVGVPGVPPAPVPAVPVGVPGGAIEPSG